MDRKERYGLDGGDFYAHHLTGWRFWRVKRCWWLPKKAEPRYRLVSPISPWPYLWAPGAVMRAKCNAYGPFGTWVRTVLVPILTVLALTYLMVVGIMTTVGIAHAFSRSPEEGAFLPLALGRASLAMLLLTVTIVVLLLVARQLPMLITRRRTRRTAVHNAPTRGCECGLFAAFSLSALLDDFHALTQCTWHREPRHSRFWRRTYVIGQAVTAGKRPRGYGGSVGFRVDMMQLSQNPLYMIAGTESIAAAIKATYGNRVIMGYPPTEDMS